MAVVRGRSMLPTLREGDRLLVLHGGRPRPGRPGRRTPAGGGGGGQARGAREPDGWWVEADNAAEGVDSRTVGAIPDDRACSPWCWAGSGRCWPAARAVASAHRAPARGTGGAVWNTGGTGRPPTARPIRRPRAPALDRHLVLRDRKGSSWLHRHRWQTPEQRRAGPGLRAPPSAARWRSPRPCRWTAATTSRWPTPPASPASARRSPPTRRSSTTTPGSPTPSRWSPTARPCSASATSARRRRCR